MLYQGSAVMKNCFVIAVFHDIVCRLLRICGRLLHIPDSVPCVCVYCILLRKVCIFLHIPLSSFLLFLIPGLLVLMSDSIFLRSPYPGLCILSSVLCLFLLDMLLRSGRIPVRILLMPAVVLHFPYASYPPFITREN